MNDMEDIRETPPASAGGRLCAIFGAVFVSTFYLSFIALPLGLAAWICGAKAVSRARRMGLRAAGSAITAKAMGAMVFVASVANLFFLFFILAAIALPNFCKYRTEAQRMSCLANMKMIQSAYEMALMGGGEVRGVGDLCGADKIIKAEPVCPAGGVYFLEDGADGKEPACSVHGPLSR